MLGNYLRTISLYCHDVPYGQGISVTQTQMLRAFTAIANDGIMLEPKFISALYDPNDQTVRKSQKEVVGNPVF